IDREASAVLSTWREDIVGGLLPVKSAPRTHLPDCFISDRADEVVRVLAVPDRGQPLLPADGDHVRDRILAHTVVSDSLQPGAGNLKPFFLAASRAFSPSTACRGDGLLLLLIVRASPEATVRWGGSRFRVSLPHFASDSHTSPPSAMTRSMTSPLTSPFVSAL